MSNSQFVKHNSIKKIAEGYEIGYFINEKIALRFLRQLALSIYYSNIKIAKNKEKIFLPYKDILNFNKRNHDPKYIKNSIVELCKIRTIFYILYSQRRTQEYLVMIDSTWEDVKKQYDNKEFYSLLNPFKTFGYLETFFEQGMEDPVYHVSHGLKIGHAAIIELQNGMKLDCYSPFLENKKLIWSGTVNKKDSIPVGMDRKWFLNEVIAAPFAEIDYEQIDHDFIG